MGKGKNNELGGFEIVLIFPDKSEDDMQIAREVRKIMVDEAIRQMNIDK